MGQNVIRITFEDLDFLCLWVFMYVCVYVSAYYFDFYGPQSLIRLDSNNRQN